ncbi:MAG TPA: universal stress protein [Gaiellaceae bacterium]|nr:universal stress protein [Gaiellaceae bacterium]
MKEILAATDGSESSRYAVGQAIELARSSGASLTVAYVRHTPLPILGQPFYQRSLSAELRLANETVELAAASAQEAGVEAETEILEGDPADRILELASLRDVDLIVVGSRGLGPIAGTLLGSVSREVLHRADRPVLVAARRVERRRAA